MKLSTRSKKSAFFLTYLLIAAQALSSMVLTRVYLNKLGAEAYGLYQMVYAVAQYILILDLGISAVMIRYLSEFEARDDAEKAENFAFHFGLVVAALAGIIVLIGAVVNRNLENIYRALTPEEYALSHRIFRVMILQLVFTIVSHYFRGICEARERFTFTRTVSITQILLNIVLTIVLLELNLGVMGIVVSNAAVIVLSVLCVALYAKFSVGFRIRFHYWDFGMLRPAFMLMLALLLQAVVGHVNGSVDKTILGIMATKTDVAVYSIAAVIITMFNSLPSTVSSVFQPEAIRLVVKQADGVTLTDYVAKLGRIQFMIIGGFIAGFILVGQEFVLCWAGKDMLPAWKYVLIILVPNAVPLMQNMCLPILNAMDKRIYRSVILALMTVLNILLTVALIRLFGPVGAPLGTGVSYVIGHCILMNVYYQRRIGLKIGRMFARILRRTWLCVLAALLLTLPLGLLKNEGSWLLLIAKGLVFCGVYAALLLLYGMNDTEKKTVSQLWRRFVNTLKKTRE